MKCEKCNKGLSNAPAIVIAEHVFCYKCAKVCEEYLNTKNKESTRKRYLDDITTYDALKSQYDIVYAAYLAAKSEESKNGWGCLLFLLFGSFIVIAPFLSGSANTVWPIWLIVTVAVFWGWTKYFSDKNKNTDIKMPVAPTLPREIEPVAVEINIVKDRNDNEDTPFYDYRKRVLLRDGFECQVCGAKKASQNLEVHHVIPQAKGGSDYLSNLVALCLVCHEREEWFGHYHKRRSL